MAERTSASCCRSEVLALDVAYLDEELRFYAGNALVLLPDEETAQLGRLVSQAQTQATEAVAQAEQERVRADEAIHQLGAAILAIFQLRGLEVPAMAIARIRACRDPALLGRWQGRALTALSTLSIFEDG